jgi:hypothetical protein
LIASWVAPLSGRKKEIKSSKNDAAKNEEGQERHFIYR